MTARSEPVLKAFERLGYFAILFAIGAGLGACVRSETAASFARRAHPECTAAKPVAHKFGSHSTTEVELTCGEIKRSVIVKCDLGLISDTVCHEPLLTNGAIGD